MNNICTHPNLIKSNIKYCDKNQRYICTKCNQYVIKNFFDHCIYNSNDVTICSICGIRRKDHYTNTHIFKPLHF